MLLNINEFFLYIYLHYPSNDSIGALNMSHNIYSFKSLHQPNLRVILVPLCKTSKKIYIEHIIL